MLAVFEWLPKGRPKKGVAQAFDWKEVKVLASFEGPTAEASAQEYIAMMDKCTPASKAACVADGISASRLAKKKGTWEECVMPI